MSSIDFTPTPMKVQEILNRYEKSQLNLNPGFQRASVWAEKDRKKLIDSILRNYPLPSIFLYGTTKDGQPVYYVIDGKQRIESILMFMGMIRGKKFAIHSQLTE